MPDNIDLAAEVSGRPVWLLSNQSDYTHKLASTHTYKKNSIRATDSVIDFPVYLCVGQYQLKAHILYFNGYVSLYVSGKYCFVSYWKFQMKFVSFAFNPFCPNPKPPCDSCLRKFGLCLLVFDRFYSTALTTFNTPVCSKKSWMHCSCIFLSITVHPDDLGSDLSLCDYNYGLQTYK